MGRRQEFVLSNASMGRSVGEGRRVASGNNLGAPSSLGRSE